MSLLPACCLNSVLKNIISLTPVHLTYIIVAQRKMNLFSTNVMGNQSSLFHTLYSFKVNVDCFIQYKTLNMKLVWSIGQNPNFIHEDDISTFN